MARIGDRYWYSFRLPLNDHLAMHMVLDLRNRIDHGSFLRRSFMSCEDFIYMGVCLWPAACLDWTRRVLWPSLASCWYQVTTSAVGTHLERRRRLSWLMRSFVNSDDLPFVYRYLNPLQLITLQFIIPTWLHVGIGNIKSRQTSISCYIVPTH